MKRLTDKNIDYEYEFCKDCSHYGEPNGCNSKNGECEAYYKFIEFADRLADLEDKLESGLLVELPCIREVKGATGMEYHICFIRTEGYNIGSIDFYRTKDKSKAEARLKELQENK